MLVGELARRTGTTIRALRYYEALGLVVPTRLPNGYRDYEPVAVRQVEEIRTLTALGLSVLETRPFVECLADGHESGDECPSSLTAYRRAIEAVTELIEYLSQRRGALETQLEAAAGRSFASTGDPLPGGPGASGDDDDVDVGFGSRFAGRRLCAVALNATDGATVRLDGLGAGRTVLYVYPLTGRPGIDLPDGWDNIPGARGCTVEACGFRDHFSELLGAGIARVYGISSQRTEYQRELVARLGLPFAVLSDFNLSLADTLGLPTFTAGGATLFRRLTMVVAAGVVEHVFYPIVSPADHAAEVLAWCRRHDVDPR